MYLRLRFSHLFTVLSLFFLSFAGQASVSMYDFDVKQWSAVDGLSSQSVRSVVQDNIGYIWAGTLFGLNRFDGKTFTTFNTKDHEGLISNAINVLFVDSTGYLWIGTQAGLSGVNPSTMIFDKYNVLGDVTDITETEDGTIWVAAQGLQKLVNKERVSQPLVKGQVNYFAVSPAGLWVMNNGVLRLTDGEETLAAITLQGALAQTLINDLYWADDTLYLATDIGVFYLDRDLNLVRLSMPFVGNLPVYSILKDSAGGLWLSTYDALYYHLGSQPWQKVVAEDLGFPPRFAALFEDRHENIWLGSFSDGIWRAHRGQITRHVPIGTASSLVRTLATDDNQNLWLGTQAGIGTLEGRDNFQLIYPYWKINRKIIYQIFFYEGLVLVGTDNGVVAYQGDNPFGEDIFAQTRHANVRVIQQRKNGDVWIGTSKGLYTWRKGEALKRYPPSLNFEAENITYVNDQGENVWIGTSRGAYKVVKDTIVERIGIGSALFRGHITSILDFGVEGLLVSTLDDGLFFQNRNGFWTQLDESKGLPYGAIVSLYYEKTREMIWVSTLKGVYRFPLSSIQGNVTSAITVDNILTQYQRQLGTVPGRCCNGIGHGKIIERNGSLLFPTLKGVVEIPMDIVVNRQIDQAPIVESLLIDSKRSINLGSKEHVRLRIEERSLVINYTVIDFTSSNRTEFRYKLDGFEEDWTYVGSRREAIFTNLEPGAFTFRIQVRRYPQEWAQAKESTITLEIPRKFSESIWYHALLGILVLLILYGVLVLIRRREVTKQQELAHLVSERTVELSEANKKLADANRKLKQLSHKDELSGLRNRQFLFEQLPKDIEHFQRNSESMIEQGKSIALIVIDIDDLKTINELHGPVAGDSVLSQVATLLNDETRSSDYVVRWGGDEFLIVLRDTYTNQIEEHIENLVRSVSSADVMLPDGRRMNTTCSVGYSLYPLNLIGGQLISWEISLSLAEMALHKVKTTGVNGVSTIEFDEQVDAFEFEESDSVAALVEHLLAIDSLHFKTKHLSLDNKF